MPATFNHAQIQQIKLAMKEVLVDELGENYKAHFDHIENKIDKVLKIVTDTHQELLLTQAKVNRHDKEIKQLQVFTGFTTA